MSADRMPLSQRQELAAPPILDLAAVSLFADLDGTLAPIEASPSDVGPDGARRRLLASLSRALSGRLAVISGRSLADLDRVLEGRIRAIAAVHGLVRRSADGHVGGQEASAAAGEAFRRLAAFAQGKPNLLVEDKGAAVALHFRRAPQLAAACEAEARRLARRLGLLVQLGDMVVELRPKGPDKGEAVAAFMREPPFIGHPPVYVGDDLTDEAGFRTANTLGGMSVIIGGRRPTAANFAIADVGATREWLTLALGEG
jgi:trehalose 6-phosphate phosphatase